MNPYIPSNQSEAGNLLPCMVYLPRFGWLILMVNVGKYLKIPCINGMGKWPSIILSVTINDVSTSPKRWKKRNMSWRDHNRFPFSSENLQRVTTVTWWMKLLFEERPRFWWFLGVFPKSMVNYCRSTNRTFNTHMHRTIWWITSKTGHMKSAFQTKHWFVWHYWMHHHSPKRLVHPRHMGNRFRNYWESATPKKVYEERSDFVVLLKNIGNIIGESSIVWAWLLKSCLWHGFWYRYFVGHHMPFTLHQKLRVAINMTFISAKTHVGCDTLIPIKTFLNPPEKKQIYIYIYMYNKFRTFQLSYTL